MKRKVMLLVMGMMLPVWAHGQASLNELKPEAYFDFWVGEWDLSWEAPNGAVEKGTNKIEKILGGTVILENFTAETGQLKGYEGKSFSVYHKPSGLWKQSWVDNNRGYIDLVGEFDGDKRIFKTRRPGPNGTLLKNRMVFKPVTADSLVWDWESSSDEGKTWALQWRIFYSRSK